MEIRISVRSFVEFLLRSGDIDNRRTGGNEDAMAEGARIHRMIQKRMGIEYQAEVTMAQAISFEEYSIIIEGRADGVIDDRAHGRVVIDEIKATYRELKRIDVPDPVHLAQAKCYAYMWAKQNRLDSIGIRMTYCNIDSEEIKYFHENFKFSTLNKWFLSLIEEYRKWSDFEYAWKKKRQESIEALKFPFPYRKGQKELVGYVYQTISKGKKLFVEAPTGGGKTISTMYPALKAVAEGKADKLFYLTAKTVTGTVAKDTLSMLREQGLCMKSALLTAKEKVCPLEECNCNPQACPFARGHYDRINDAVYDLLEHEDEFDREKILDYALSHEVCPFEMGLDMSLFSDTVICDYNYLFDPRAYLRRFFADGITGSYLFLIDEAHNLVERGRSMYSATLVKEDILAVKNIVEPYSPYLAKLFEKCNRELLVLKKQCENYEILKSHASFVEQVNRLHGAINNYLEDHEDSPVKDELLNYYFELSRFLDVYDRMDEDYVVYTGYEDDGSFFIKEFCVDPARQLKECMDKGVSTILFSATFLPIQYYKSLLGGDQEDYEVYAKSTFDPKQQIQLIGNEVTSRYLRRNDREYENIACYIHELIRARVGNYLVFFPSHAFLDAVYDAFQAMYGEDEISIIVQESRMREDEREAFLDQFSFMEDVDFRDKIQMEVLVEEDEQSGVDRHPEGERLPEAYRHTEGNSRTLLGFCVLGGIFGEGIDLKRDSLIGSIIVGTGLPQVCPEREILKNYFDETGKNGFDYAYRYPGMNKVLQAAGRVIRTADDRGIIALLDERFVQSGYQKMFPAEWQNLRVISMDKAKEEAEKFWV